MEEGEPMLTIYYWQQYLTYQPALPQSHFLLATAVAFAVAVIPVVVVVCSGGALSKRLDVLHVELSTYLLFLSWKPNKCPCKRIVAFTSHLLLQCIWEEGWPSLWWKIHRVTDWQTGIGTRAIGRIIVTYCHPIHSFYRSYTSDHHPPKQDSRPWNILKPVFPYLENWQVAVNFHQLETPKRQSQLPYCKKMVLSYLFIGKPPKVGGQPNPETRQRSLTFILHPRPGQMLYPAVSLRGRASFNFGPDFKYPVPQGWREKTWDVFFCEKENFQWIFVHTAYHPPKKWTGGETPKMKVWLRWWFSFSKQWLLSGSKC